MKVSPHISWNKQTNNRAWDEHHEGQIRICKPVKYIVNKQRKGRERKIQDEEHVTTQAKIKNHSHQIKNPNLNTRQ